MAWHLAFCYTLPYQPCLGEMFPVSQVCTVHTSGLNLAEVPAFQVMMGRAYEVCWLRHLLTSGGISSPLLLHND